MVALVREFMPESLLDWLGSIVDHPERWVAIFLDGEIDHEGSAEDVRAAEVYGRSKRAYRDLPVFELDNEGAREAMRARSKLRDKLAPVLRVSAPGMHSGAVLGTSDVRPWFSSCCCGGGLGWSNHPPACVPPACKRGGRVRYRRNWSPCALGPAHGRPLGVRGPRAVQSAACGRYRCGAQCAPVSPSPLRGGRLSVFE